MKPYLPVLLIAAGGILGSLARYGVTVINRPNFPIGTLLVNLVGCLIMGFLLRWTELGLAKTELRLFLGLGFLGALTTFSTFSGETLSYFLRGQATAGLLYIAYTTGGCLVTVTVGYMVARAIWTG